jgi:hypothetical protein
LSAGPAQAVDKFAAEFLKVGVGARAMGMGGAFVALANDATASYWNPAGLAQLREAEFSLVHKTSRSNRASEGFRAFDGSAAFTTLIEEARQEYDTVIIDTPPVLPVTDAILIGRLVDGVVQVVMAGRTHRRDVQRTQSLITSGDIQVLGIVLNNLYLGNRAYSYYYRRYYGYYGYGYGQKQD